MSGNGARGPVPLEGGPRLDWPEFTRPCEEVLTSSTSSRPLVPDTPALPELDETDGSRVIDPVDEPLVAVRHRRIRILANYWHAGWRHAVAETWLRRTVARRLYQVADALEPRWGLAVFDAWRPLELQAELYEAAYADPRTPAGFMAPVSDDPAEPPPHLTGGAVDLTLTVDGIPLAPGCGFDDTTTRARAAALEDEAGVDRAVRRYLYWSMRREGFIVFAGEWWHFELGTRRWAAITGRPARYGPASPASAG